MTIFEKTYSMGISYAYKYIMHLSYLGTNFSGWQIQDNAKTIQGVLMEALKCIVHKDIPLIVGAGRTDSGVHAINFYAHFEWDEINMEQLKYKMNRFLPIDIVIHSINRIDIDFHARYSAKSRKYEYWISTVKDPFLINRAYFLEKTLNLELMNLGAEMFIGKKDFSAFSKSKSSNSCCSIKSAYWVKSKNMLIFSIESDRFLYNMVRCIVGTLINLGLEKINLDQLSNIMLSYSRSHAGYSVPACGLYLVDIKYPKVFSLESI